MLANHLTAKGELLKNRILEIAGAADELPLIFNKGIEQFTQGRENSSSGTDFLKAMAISVLSAGLLMMLIRRFILKAHLKNRSSRFSYEDGASANTFEKLKYHTVTVSGKTLILGSFSAISALVFLLFFEHEPRDYLAFFFYLAALCILGLAVIIFKSFYSPDNSYYRLPIFDDFQAKCFFLTSIGTIGFGAIAYFTCALMYTLGVGGYVHELFLIIITGLTAAFLSLTLLINRKAITYDLAYQATSSRRKTFATVWPWLFAMMVLTLWTFLVLAELLADHVPYGAALLTLALMGIVPHFDALLYREEMRCRDDIEKNWQMAMARGIRIFVYILTLSSLLFVWNLAPTDIDEQSSASVQLTSSIMSSLLMIATAYAFWHIAKVAIDRRIEAEDRANPNAGQDLADNEIGGAGLSRTRTLLPLLKRSVQVVIFLTVVFSVLAEFGVNITPLLAGAGVVGLAIGFGSQTLVRDVVSGAFFLLDDAVRIGEYIDVGSVQGSVEQMSIRSLQLRHHLGAIHTIPFGEIKTLTNHSRDWVIMKLRFRLPFDTDLEKVRKLLKKVGQQLAQEDMIKEDFIQPFKSQGAIETDDHGFVISTKFMSKPGKQFLIRRYAFNAIQKSFEANGINFARPTVSVKADFDKDDDEKEKKIIGAASNQVAEDIRNKQPQEETKPTTL